MQIFVRSSAKLLALNIDKDDTVQDIYEQVAQEAGCAKDDIVLSVRGVPLNDEQTLEDFDLVPGTTIDTIVKVLGGKTHGNLGKAGWVKKNTPKVAPQEKPKKKTGRARRREQYNQRFVNKVASPLGVRRGPNSNY